MFLQQVLNGLTMGSIYALLAIGVSLVYKAMGMLNFAHGDTMMVGTFICLTLYLWGLPFYIAAPLAVLSTAALGLFLERVLYRNLEFSSFSNLLIATVGVSFVLRNSSIVIWGNNPQLFPQIFSTVPINISGFMLLPQNIGYMIIAAVIVVVLQLFFNKTKEGKCMRAAASDSEGAAMMGINVNRTRFLTFGISAAFAAIAGILLAPMTFARTDMSVIVGLKAFAAAILGGFGDLRGAIVGGLLLGIVEALGATYISTSYKDVIAFLVLFSILYFKPTGLLAKRVETKL